MSESELDSLIHMANQIADNNTYHDDEQTVGIVSNHLQRFWARSMKQQIIDYANSNGGDLNPVALQAVKLLAERT